MKNNASIIYVLALCIAIASGNSCSKENRWDCIKRTGKPSTDIRLLPPFTKIYLKDNIDVFISQGSTQEVKIETGSNLISLIKTRVDSGILHISNDNRCNWARSYKNGCIKIYVTMPTFRFLWHFGSGLVKSGNAINCDTLDIWAHQTGNADLTVNASIIYTNMHTTADVTLHGKSNSLGNWHVGEGYLHCEDLLVNSVWTESNASGDEYFNVQNDLITTIDWIGNIYYSGSPVITLSGQGKGKLIKHN
jgi:Putative auto-transporter adhesin, head GIN domain